jgi:hypothetical protein
MLAAQLAISVKRSILCCRAVLKTMLITLFCLGRILFDGLMSTAESSFTEFIKGRAITEY